MTQLLKNQSLIDKATHNMYDSIMQAGQFEKRIWIGLGAMAGAVSIFTKIPFTLVPMVMIGTSYMGYKLSQTGMGSGGVFFKLISSHKINEEKTQIASLIAKIRQEEISPYNHINLYNTVKIQECLIETLEAYMTINSMGHSDLISEREIAQLEGIIKAVQNACEEWGKTIGSVNEELYKSNDEVEKEKEKIFKFTLLYNSDQKYIIEVLKEEIDIFLASVNIFDSNLFLGNIYSKINVLEVFLEQGIRITNHHYEQFLYFVKTLHSQTYKRFYHSTIIAGGDNISQLRRIFNTFLDYEEKHNTKVVDWEQIDSIIRPVFLDNSLDEEYLSLKKTTYGKKLYYIEETEAETREKLYQNNESADISNSAFNNSHKEKEAGNNFYLNVSAKRKNSQNNTDTLNTGTIGTDIGNVGQFVGQLSHILVPQSVTQLLANNIEVDLALENLKTKKVLFMQGRDDVLKSWNNLNRSKGIIEANLGQFDIGARTEINLLLDKNLQEVLDEVERVTSSPMTETTKLQLIEMCLARIFFIELHLSKFLKSLEEKQANEFGGQIQYQKNKAQYDYLKTSK